MIILLYNIIIESYFDCFNFFIPCNRNMILLYIYIIKLYFYCYFFHSHINNEKIISLYFRSTSNFKILLKDTQVSSGLAIVIVALGTPLSELT